MSDLMKSLSRDKRRSIKFRFTKVRESSSKLKENILNIVNEFEIEDKESIEVLERSLKTAIEVKESLESLDDEQKERVEASGSKVKTLTKEEKDEELKKIKKESDFVTECEVKASDFDVRHDDVRNVDYICDKSLSILVKANRYKVSLKMYNGDVVSVNEEFRATGYDQLLRLVTASSQVNLDNPNDVKSVNVMNLDDVSEMKTFGVRSRISLKGDNE